MLLLTLISVLLMVTSPVQGDDVERRLETKNSLDTLYEQGMVIADYNASLVSHDRLPG
jgi:hypothetical protein